jgi:chorismate-pyruvate lyase
MIPCDTSAVERMLIANKNTNQTLLSILFKTPIKVNIISQIEYDNIVIRWVQLVAEYSPSDKLVVCLAESIIPKEGNTSGFLTAIYEKHFGIGQIIQASKLNTERDIIGCYVDTNIIARNYIISGQASVVITETFPRDVLKKAEEVV